MKVPVCAFNFASLIRRLLPAVFAGMLLCSTHSADAALAFGRGTASTVGCVKFSSSPDSVTITAALTAPGTITSALAIPANRIQYDVINCDIGNMQSWTLFYSPAVGPAIIGAATPVGYVTAGGVIVPQGGVAYTTLFNAGYGIYNYNTGAPWIIDYEPDHITFVATGAVPPGLPPNDGAGFVNPNPYLPSFDIDYDPHLANGLVPASAQFANGTMNGQVYGPVPGNSCLSIQCTNITVKTCNSCAPVNFAATAIDTCCPTGTPVLQYNPPSGTCFPVNTTTTVQVTAFDNCNNVATNYFTVTVNQDPNCAPTNCISITATDIVAHTCNPCTPVTYNVSAIDNCCPGAKPTLIFNPPETTCFPVNSSTTVKVTAFDQCGKTNTTSFTVTVLPGPDCGNTNCIRLVATNIIAYTCSSCTTVPFNVTAFDQCCSNVVLTFNPPTNTCFPLNSSTTVQINASDACGNTATRFIKVTVLPGPNCNPTNCITIYASNIVAYTCSNCVAVPYTASVVDTCCAAGATLTFNPPPGTCFPLGTTTVNVSASDKCGNGAVSSFKVTVLPRTDCNTNCITINATNITAYTCSNCLAVPYTAYAVDTCCAAGATLTFNPPSGTCFPLGSTTTVNVSASDDCGNGAISSFTVTVLPGSGCNPNTNCISLRTTNIVAYTCDPCVPVSYNGFATDNCCPVSGVTIIYNPPVGTCFPLNTTTPVQASAFDACGNGQTNFFMVTVLPLPNCGGSNPLTISGSTGPGAGGTNYFTIYWPPTNAQLLESGDLKSWNPVPGTTNSPYIVPNLGGMKFYRLQYQ
jgi:hypothetical protein